MSMWKTKTLSKHPVENCGIYTLDKGIFIFKEIKHLSLSIPVLFLDVLAAGLTDYPSTINKNHYCCSNIVRILVKPVHSEHI